MNDNCRAFYYQVKSMKTTIHKTTWISLSLLFACSSVKPVVPELVPTASLPAELMECSGMAVLDSDLYVSNNDSGNAAELYIYSLKADRPMRTVTITGVDNKDWEELSADDQYVYIGDTGNNRGKRQDLAIYRIPKEKLLQEDVVEVEKIFFHYPEQESFESSKTHNFDCEAFAIYGDSIYLFTKNRGNLKTNLYRIPKVPGHYAAKLIGEFDAGFLVTGADVRSLSDNKSRLALIGYAKIDGRYQVYMLDFNKVDGAGFFKTKPRKWNFDLPIQTESIAFIDDHTVLITNEGEHGDRAMVHRLNLTSGK